jgi:hypothetical protein
MTAVDNISINKAFWLSVQEHMMSFRFNGMLEDVHFSIAYNDNSPDINLHVTRNVGDAANKPKIEIVRITKIDAEELLPSLGTALLNLMLQPIQLKSFGRRNRHSHYGIYFHPLGETENNPVNQWLKEELTNRIKPLATIKKRRLKIKGDIGTTIKPIVGDTAFADIFEKSLRWLPRKPFEQAQAGLIISRKFKGCAVCINNKWYSIQLDVKPLDFLCAWMEPILAKHLIFKTLMAYTRIKGLSSRSESEKHNNSLRLHKISY